MRPSITYALWAALAGAFIPVMAVLNSRLAKALGSPVHAAVILFTVGLIGTAAFGLGQTGRLPDLSLALRNNRLELLGGVIVAFYIVSVTALAPRMGIGNVIIFVMCAQLVSSVLIDHFGVFGVVMKPIELPRLAGLVLMVFGVCLAQMNIQKGG